MLVITEGRSIANLEKKSFNPEWLRPVLDDVAEGFLLETSERIVYLNHAYASFLGYEAHELVEREVSYVVAVEDAPRLLHYSRSRTNLEPAPHVYDFLAQRKDDSTIRLAASVSSSLVDHTVLIAAVARVAPDAVEPEKPQAARSPLASLSRRELQVMEMILAGKRIKEIALDLSINVKTVATHRARMLDKLHIPDSRALFQFAVKHRLIDWK